MARLTSVIPSWLRVAGLPALLLLGTATATPTANADAGIRLPKKKKKGKKKKSKKAPFKLPKLKKRPKGKLKFKPSGDGSVKGNLAAYKNSRTLLHSSDSKVKAARDSIKGAGETNRSASAIKGVPLPSGLSDLRRMIVTMASRELGRIDPNPSPPILPPWSPAPGSLRIKGGVDRLAEYNAVAYGTNASLWLAPGTLTKLVTAGQKHTTWCGIFALWAVKMGAGVTASNFRHDWAKVLPTWATPVFAFFGTKFIPEPDGFLRYKSTYQNLQWGSGAIFFDYDPYDAVPAKKLAPTGIKNWVAKKGTAPPIKPGDIGYTREPVFAYPIVNGKRKQVRTGAVTYHHYVVDRVMEVDGKVMYFTIEGNYFSKTSKKNQSVVRNFRVYDPNYKHTTAGSGRHNIEGWYDIDVLPRFKHNRHTKPTGQQL